HQLPRRGVISGRAWRANNTHPKLLDDRIRRPGTHRLLRFLSPPCRVSGQDDNEPAPALDRSEVTLATHPLHPSIDPTSAGDNQGRGAAMAKDAPACGSSSLPSQTLRAPAPFG